MSGGRLVVLDRNGRDVKRYPLPSGLATLGSDPACDIRVMLSSVSAHHATVVVHSNQTLVRNVGGGDTLVNDKPVSVAALSHGDVISVGGRSLRWEYTEPTTTRHQKTEPALAVWRRGAGRGRGGRQSGGRPSGGRLSGGRRSAAAAAAPVALAREPALRLALEMTQRASMPGGTGGKQVAIVQPQRRDTREQDDKGSSRSPGPANKRQRASKNEPDPSAEADSETSKRKSSALQSTTKATLWIESRKSSPKKAGKPLAPIQAPRSRRSLPSASRRQATPLRLAVLKRPRPPKIQAPLLLDQTKRAAILLMAGHTPRSRLPAHQPPAPQVRQRASWTAPPRPRRSPRTSPPLASPRKSALKDPAGKRRARKTESIKFDLSNLEDRPTEAGRPRRSTRGGRPPPSPAGGSARAGLLLRRALDASRASPAGAPGLEAYSIVDLVSVDSDESMRSASAYGSAGSDASAAFGTPATSATSGGARLLSCSTPYLGTDTLGASRLSAASTTPRAGSQSTPENSEDARKQVTLTDVRKSRGSRSRSRIDDSDLVFIDDDDEDSPRSSRSSRRGKASAAGTRTPESAAAPAEATTPVLSIQSLLDSSRSSVGSQGSVRRGRPSAPSFLTKRRTPGSAAGSFASDRSASFTARKTRLRLSSDSVEEVGDADEEAATPRSAAKPSPEAVKNKHSTAKKPQSKRSIIDDLNESDVVKQLFNSPVKRKLSQSMTELSRKRVFADEESAARRRPARNTYAGPSRSPDDSLPEPPDAYTPERFVSPVGTPGHSPDLDGIKRMFGRTLPSDDLTDVRGVKALLRTPRARRSARNDLTDVSGVKAVFGRSPANRLSDVRVKEVFAAPPADDLRRVTGVPSLFKRRSRRSPRNDLTDVRGVKPLFGRNSPRDDLSDVSGVKRTMRRNSPRNDYTDVRGVRGMFGRGNPKNSLGDVSGVEELFNTSNLSHEDSESLFDRLIGKPTVRAVYSKTFVAKRAPKAKRQPRKSLAASLDLITNNVEQWLEQELRKRLHKKDEGRTAESSKRNLTRELQKLATDTVAGSTPLRNSRVRAGSASRSGSAGRKRSAADVYGAHTLPLKKRSLVEKPCLPIKKRAVVHSTPVKGRLNVTMNASELGRVSPIAAVDKTTAADHETSIRLTRQSEEAVKPRGHGRTKLADDDRMPPPPQIKAPSPRKTRGKAKVASPGKAKRASPARADPSPAKSKEISPVKPRATRHAKGKTANRKTKPASPAKADAATPTRGTRSTRARRNLTPVDSNVKKRRASIVIAKKAPAMSPKPPATRTKARAKTTPEPAKASKPTRKTRGTRVDKTEEKVKSPKNTRTKAQKVAGEAPPPRANKSRETLKVQLQEPNKPKRGRPAKVQSPEESPVETKRKTRGNDTRSVSTARGRKTVEKQDSKDSAPATTRRGRKTTATESTDGAPALKADVPPKQTKARGRSNKVQAQESQQAELTERPTRGRRQAKQEPAPANTRKRKATDVEEVPAKVAKVAKVAKAAAGGRGTKAADETVAPGRQKRGARGGADPPAAPRTRGKKVADVSESVSVAGKRKRKKSVEPSPVKGGRARRR